MLTLPRRVPIPSVFYSGETEAPFTHCLVHETPVEELSEYQILAHCQGGELLLSHLPILLGGPAMDALAQCLSKETLDELGGFRDAYLGPAPELRRDLHGPVLV